MAEPFAITDCALIVVATGEKAHNLRELHDRLQRMEDPGVMYFHFWDGLLRPNFVDPEYQNDFSAWAYRHLHDRRLAERLSLINPGDYRTMSALRQRVIHIIEDRMDEGDFDPHRDAEHSFYFMRSQIVIFDTRMRVHTPEEMGARIPKMSTSSIFYHFIDARRRTVTRRNDFVEWLKASGDQYGPMADAIAMIDPYFNTLLEMRAQLAAVFEHHLGTLNQ
jgi:hypothetical protein